MSLFTIWPSFGLQENPYSQATLSADEVGDRLLVGRDAEVQQLQAAIGLSGSHPTVEGPIGAGKSSLIAVAEYRMLRRCLDARARQLYLPARRFFQAQENLEAFETDVYFSLAQTLVQNVKSFSDVDLEEPNVGALGKWLNSPDYKSGGASASVLGTGGGAELTIEPNEGEGFLRSGLPELVQSELTRCFPEGTGGIVCVIDNLELLQSTGGPATRWTTCATASSTSRNYDGFSVARAESSRELGQNG